MAFCPECRYEYVSEVTTCPDCNVALVAQLSEEYHPDIDWVELHRFPGPVYAEMMREVLENADIPCILRKDFLSGAYGAQGTETGGLETAAFVPSEKLAPAKELLEQTLDV